MLADAPPGPLHGVPIAVKDMFRLPWRGPRDGTPREALPPGESGVYRLLRDSGAVIVGVTNMHFWGGGSTGHISARCSARRGSNGTTSASSRRWDTCMTVIVP